MGLSKQQEYSGLYNFRTTNKPVKERNVRDEQKVMSVSSQDPKQNIGDVKLLFPIYVRPF